MDLEETNFTVRLAESAEDLTAAKRLRYMVFVEELGANASNSDPARHCPEDKVERTFKANAPDKLWVADSSYVQTSMAMACAVFIIDVFVRMIVGWRVSTSMTTSFVNQAICRRRPAQGGLILHSDRGMLCLSIRCAERLAEADIEMSVGRVGDSYDNALAESVIGLFKTEVVKHLGPWETVGQVEWETLKWVH